MQWFAFQGCNELLLRDAMNYLQGCNELLFRDAMYCFSGMKWIAFQGCNELLFRDAMNCFSGMQWIAISGCNELLFRDAMNCFSGCNELLFRDAMNCSEWMNELFWDSLDKFSGMWLMMFLTLRNFDMFDFILSTDLTLLYSDVHCLNSTILMFFYRNCEMLQRSCNFTGGDHLLAIRCLDYYDACAPDTNTCFWNESCIDLPTAQQRLCYCPSGYEGDGYNCTGLCPSINVG